MSKDDRRKEDIHLELSTVQCLHLPLVEDFQKQCENL